MAEDMIEKVARAMFERGWPPDSREGAVKLNPNIMDSYRDLARAAVAALREPSEGMRKAMDEIIDTMWDSDPHMRDMVAVLLVRSHRHVIDSILQS